MTKILSEKFETLSVEKQAEVLKYIDFLSTKKHTKRMTMDKHQGLRVPSKMEDPTVHVHYTIW